jgi:hypothetical protein
VICESVKTLAGPHAKLISSSEAALNFCTLLAGLILNFLRTEDTCHE